MYHRLVEGSIGTGLGNPNKAILNNQWTENEKLNTVLKNMFEECISNYFEAYEGIDFSINIDNNKFDIKMGLEPSYQYEPLKIVNINSDKEQSYIQTGKSWGAYGTGIAKTTKYYKDYKKNGKFVKFINKWHEILLKEIETISN